MPERLRQSASAKKYGGRLTDQVGTAGEAKIPDLDSVQNRIAGNRHLQARQEATSVPLQRHGAGRCRGTAAAMWKAAIALVGWLSDQQITLATVTESDLDRFVSTSQGAKLAQRVEVFVNWARPRGHTRDV